MRREKEGGGSGENNTLKFFKFQILIVRVLEDPHKLGKRDNCLTLSRVSPF